MILGRTWILIFGANWNTPSTYSQLFWGGTMAKQFLIVVVVARCCSLLLSVLLFLGLLDSDCGTLGRKKQNKLSPRCRRWWLEPLGWHWFWAVPKGFSWFVGFLWDDTPRKTAHMCCFGPDITHHSINDGVYCYHSWTANWNRTVGRWKPDVHIYLQIFPPRPRNNGWKNHVLLAWPWQSEISKCYNNDFQGRVSSQ